MACPQGVPSFGCCGDNLCLPWRLMGRERTTPHAVCLSYPNPCPGAGATTRYFLEDSQFLPAINRWIGPQGGTWWQGDNRTAFANRAYHQIEFRSDFPTPVTCGPVTCTPPSNPLSFMSQEIAPAEMLALFQPWLDAPWPATGSFPRPRGWIILQFSGLDANGNPVFGDELPIAISSGDFSTESNHECAQTVYRIVTNENAGGFGELLPPNGWNHPRVTVQRTRARVKGDVSFGSYCLYDTDEADLIPNVNYQGGNTLRPGAVKRNCRRVFADRDGWVEIPSPTTPNTRTWFNETCSCE